MRVALASLTCVIVAAGAAAQDVSSAERRAVTLHRLLFTGDLDPPQTPPQLAVMTELALAYRNGTGVAADIDLACSFAFMAATEAGRTMPGTPLETRASELRGQACSEVRDTAVAMQMLGCPTFGVTPHTFGIGPSAVARLDRSGIQIDTPAGTQLHPLGLTCGEIVAGVRHIRVNPPANTRLRPRDFLELTTWTAKVLHGGTAPSRTLTWRLIELHPFAADPARDILDVLTEPAWAWPTPPVPPEIADGASFRMLTTGQVRWRFDRAPELGTGLVEPSRP